MIQLYSVKEWYSRDTKLRQKKKKQLNNCVSLPPCGNMCLSGKVGKFLQEENKHFRFENRQEKNENRKKLLYLIYNRIFISINMCILSVTSVVNF